MTGTVQYEQDQDQGGPGTLHVEDSVDAKGYVVFPRYIMFATNLTPLSKMLWAFLMNYAQQKDKCFPGQTRLCRHLECTDKTLRTHMKHLEDAGLLKVQRRGQGRTNIYTLARIRDANLEVAEYEIEPLGEESLNGKNSGSSPVKNDTSETESIPEPEKFRIKNRSDSVSRTGTTPELEPESFRREVVRRGSSKKGKQKEEEAVRSRGDSPAARAASAPVATVREGGNGGEALVGDLDFLAPIPTVETAPTPPETPPQPQAASPLSPQGTGFAIPQPPGAVPPGCPVHPDVYRQVIALMTAPDVCKPYRGKINLDEAEIVRLLRVYPEEDPVEAAEGYTRNYRGKHKYITNVAKCFGVALSNARQWRLERGGKPWDPKSHLHGHRAKPEIAATSNVEWDKICRYIIKDLDGGRPAVGGNLKDVEPIATRDGVLYVRVHKMPESYFVNLMMRVLNKAINDQLLHVRIEHEMAAA